MKLKPFKDMRARRQFLEQHCTPAGEIFCGERRDDHTNILLLGDSRGIDMYVALKEAYPEANVMVSYAMGCAPVFSEEVSRLSPFFPNCPEFNQARLQMALEAPDEDIIFLASQINFWREEAIRETVERLTEAGKTVVVLGQFSFVKHRTPVEIAIDLLRFGDGGGGMDKYIVPEPYLYDSDFADYLNALGAVYVSHKQLFFDGEYRFTDPDTGRLLTLDGVHLNMFGARKFGAYLREYYPLPE